MSVNKIDSFKAIELYIRENGWAKKGLFKNSIILEVSVIKEVHGCSGCDVTLRA